VLFQDLLALAPPLLNQPILVVLFAAQRGLDALLVLGILLGPDPED
jgi:hypothetical protein